MARRSALRALLEDAHLKGFNEGALQQRIQQQQHEVAWDDTGDTDERDDYIDDVLETV